VTQVNSNLRHNRTSYIFVSNRPRINWTWRDLEIFHYNTWAFLLAPSREELIRQFISAM